MENPQKEYLPDYILSGLTLRLFNKLGGFYSDCLPKNNPNVIKACESIEQNVQNVYNVITDAIEKMSNNRNLGYVYRHFLTSVYVLVYYRHRDEDDYQLVVFDPLKDKMGDFASKNIINQTVDKMLEEDVKLQAIQAKKNTTSNLQQGLMPATGMTIRLADKRGSDFVRAIQAMCLCGYFEHKNKTSVTPTEVGSMLVKLLGRNTEWKSLLQSAFECDNPLKTFDELRDSAQNYWQNRTGIKNN